MKQTKIASACLILGLGLTTATCSRAASGMACSTITVRSSGSQSELAHEASLLAKYLQVYLHTLAKIPSGTNCTLQVVATGNLGVRPGYTLALTITGPQANWSQTSEIRDWFPSHSRAAFNTLKSLAEQGIVRPRDSRILKNSSQKDLQSVFCDDEIPVDPLPISHERAIELEYYQRFQRQLMCSDLCENVLSFNPSIEIQTEHLPVESYPFSIYMGSARGVVEYQRVIARRYRYIDGFGVYMLAGSELPINATQSMAKTSTKYRYEENTFFFGGSVIEKNVIIQYKDEAPRLIARSLRYRPDPQHSASKSLMSRLQVSGDLCYTPERPSNFIEASRIIFKAERSR